MRWFIIKPIQDFKGYFITSDGKVFCNLGRGNRDRSKTVDYYEIMPRETKKGYLRVYMRQTSTNKRVDKYIHRLVAENYIDKPLNKNIVNHKDCDVSNNDVSNLEWLTQKENLEYAMRLGRLKRDDKGRYCT